MKAKRALFVPLLALMLLLFCSALLFACNDISFVRGDGATAEFAKSTGTDSPGLASSQQIASLNKSASEPSADTVALSSTTKTGIYIGGGEITSDRKSGSGWRYDLDSNTLTLYGYYSPSSIDNTLGLTKDLFPEVKGQACQAHIAIDSNSCTSLTIKVKGEYASRFGDVDDTDGYDKDNYIYYGIYAPGVDLIMDIEDDYAPMKYDPVYYPLQIYTNRDAVYCKNLTIKGGGGLRADSCIGSSINCQDLSVDHSRLMCFTQHGNNIYHGIVGHTTAVILASGSVTFAGGSIEVCMQNTAPKVGSIWAAYQIDVYGIKAGSINIKGDTRVTVRMEFLTAVTQNVSFKATGIYASSCTSYDGGRLYTKMQANDTIPDDASLYGCYIEDHTYFLGGNTTIGGELTKPNSKSFKLESFMQNFPLPLGSMSTSIEDTKYNYTANISALYLRNNGGTLQYARNVLFNDAATLSSSEIDMADFADINSYNVYAVSGDWRIKPTAGDNKSTFVVLGGSVSLEMSGGSTYGSLDLYTYTGATVSLSGDGIVGSLSANGCNDIGVANMPSYGSVNFQSGTVKSGWANSGCSIIFYGGNINIDYEDKSESNPYHKWTFDFGEYADLISFQTDLSFASGSFDRTGLYPIDGKLYSWDKYQTNGTLFRLLKYATVRPTSGYIYYLYPKAAEGERTFSMQRLAETDVFIANSSIDTQLYLANGDKLALSAGIFGKQVTRPATVFGGSSSTEILEGTTTTESPSGFTVSWTRTDKDGNVTKLGSDLSLSAQVKAIEDDGSIYRCTVYHGGTPESEIELRIYVFDYNPTGLTPKLANKDETVYFTFSFDDFKGYNDWIADGYDFIWQIDTDGSGSFADIAGTENQKTLSVTVASDDSYKALYRVRCYSEDHYVSGSTMKHYPTFYTTTANLTFRELPSFSGKLTATPSDNYAGVTKSYSIGLNNCYTSVVSVWFEYSTDDGQTWQRTSNDPVFENGADIILQTIYLSPYGKQVTDSRRGSFAVNVTFSTEMNGWKLRCVMQSGDYVVYSNEATFTVLDLAVFTIQPESTVVLTASDPLTLSAYFDEDYTDEDGNGISDMTYQWMYETWSNGGYDSRGAVNNMTTNTLYYESAYGIGSVSRYRLRVKFTYNGKEYIRYSDYAYVYILYQPTFDDGGVVIDAPADGIYTEGDSASWNVKDNGVFFHYYKTYRFEMSRDGGETWQSVGDAFTQSYDNTTYTFSLNSLSVTDGGLYRCKVSITKEGVTVCSYSDVTELGVVSALSVNGDPQSFAVTLGGKLTLTAAHGYSSNISATYQWQGYDAALGWVGLSGENYLDTDKIAMYTFGSSVSAHEKYRCLVRYSLQDGTSIDAYTDELAPILVVVPTVKALPVDQTVWLGNSVRFILLIDAPTENYTVIWEISNDGGVTWESAISPIRCEAGEEEYSLLCSTTAQSMNGAMFRCTVTNAVGDTSETLVTEPVTLTVRDGHVSTEQELLEALHNGMTELKLLDDITLSATVIIRNDTTLDLCGHSLSYQSSEASGSVIRIIDDASLTITDSMPDAVHSDSGLPLGGIISGGTGCALGTDGDSTLGGGILIEKGSLIFAGGTIYACRATLGGGIYASALSSLSLEGGDIEACSATEGGGIYSESDIDIKDGTITACTAGGGESGGTSDALYLNESTLSAVGGVLDGTVTLKGSSVVLPDGSADTTEFRQTVYCDASTVNGGAYMSDVIGADTSNAVTVTYMDGERTVKKLIIELGQRALSVSIPDADGRMLVWFNGDTVYDLSSPVTNDLTLTAKWYVTAEVADSLAGELDKTQKELDGAKNDLSEAQSELDKAKNDISEAQNELNKAKNDLSEAQNELDELHGEMNSAAEDNDRLNDKLSTTTAWMVVSIVMFGLSGGTLTAFLILYHRKKKIIK